MNRNSLPIRLFDWSGKHAAGDDLLHRCTVRLIEEACERENTDPVFRRGFGYRSAVVGGGTIFGHGVYFGRVRRRIAFDRVPYTVFCTGVRAPERDLNEKEIERLVKFCAGSTGIGVRGTNSKKWLDHYGISGSEIIGDAALSFNPQPAPELPGDFKVGICLRFMRGGFRKEEQTGTNEKNIALFAQLCDELSNNFGASLFFFNFSRNRFDNDGVAINSVISRMRNRTAAATAAVFPYDGNMDPDTAFSRLSRLDFTISQRLHPALVSWISGVPALALEYQFGKAADAFSILDLPESVADIGTADCGCIVQSVQDIISRKQALLNRASSNATVYKNRQIAFMRRFIGSIAV
jgi:hypothetical protein